MVPAARTIQYGYAQTGWKDLMTSYNGQSITYDEIGNPLTYRDGMTMTWTGAAADNADAKRQAEHI